MFLTSVVFLSRFLPEDARFPKEYIETCLHYAVDFYAFRVDCYKTTRCSNLHRDKSFPVPAVSHCKGIPANWLPLTPTLHHLSSTCHLSLHPNQVTTISDHSNGWKLVQCPTQENLLESRDSCLGATRHESYGKTAIRKRTPAIVLATSINDSIVSICGQVLEHPRT